MTDRKLTVIVCLFCNFCMAQFTVYELDITSNKLLFNEMDSSIYVSIPSANGNNGNSIGKINPQTVELETTTFVGSEPNEIAMSDNGEFLYIGFDSSPIVKRFNINLQTITQQTFLGTHYTGGQQLFAEDIEVMPGNPNTIAVARKRLTTSPRHGGVVIIENGIRLPNEVNGHTGSNKIEFKNSEMLLGYNNETTGFRIYELGISSEGATATNQHDGVLTGFSVDILLRNNRLYSTNGRAIDLDPIPFQLGMYSGVNGPVYYNSTLNHIIFASSTSFGTTVNLTIYNAETFLLVDEFTISNTEGQVRSITGCGDGCYAFNTTDKIYILKSINTGVSDVFSNPDVVIYPNPTRGSFSIKSNIGIQSAELLDLNGKRISLASKNDKFDLTGFNSGLYILKLMDDKGNHSTHRIIKD